jgi:hypothetical protein
MLFKQKFILTIIIGLMTVSAIVLASHSNSSSGYSIFKDNGTKPVVNCVKWTKVARFADFAYNHLVYLENSCKVEAVCKVSTNVNPSPVMVSIKPKEKKTVLTFRNSPAREFNATVVCRQK